ncbi:MAG: hypothetical protein WBN23_15965 [Woeseia sp.]
MIDRLQELHSRLSSVHAPGTSIPVVQSAAIAQRALNALEDGMRQSAAVLQQDIRKQLATASALANGNTQALQASNKKLAMLQLRADSLFSTFDLLQDATAIRSDAAMGRMLRGVDVLLEHALHRPIPGYTPPLAVSYLDSSGRGGAIARARTRLPGGFILGAALVRVSPEALPLRLSSILHEAGHQLSVDLGLLHEARAKVMRVVERTTGHPAAAKLYGSWVGELMADCWGIVLGGGAPAVDGLQRVLSLPEQLLYLIRRNAPHPPGPVRVSFADAASRLVYPDPCLDTLQQRFAEIYGTPTLPRAQRARFRTLLKATPGAAHALMTEPFDGLGGRALVSCGAGWMVHPTRIRKFLPALHENRLDDLARCPPLQGLAVLGFARIAGHLPVHRLSRITSDWLQGLADRSFRDIDLHAAADPQLPQSRSPMMRTM